MSAISLGVCAIRSLSCQKGESFIRCFSAGFVAGQLNGLIKSGSRCTFMSEYYNAMSVREQVQQSTASLSQHPLYASNHFHGYSDSLENPECFDLIKSLHKPSETFTDTQLTAGNVLFISMNLEMKISE